MKFELLKTDPASNARRGRIRTDHGTIETPIFMPVGTVGSVKGVYHRDLKADIGAQIILGNTYHLYLRPGLETLRMAGGLHRFAGWDRPILTDSGGFQVFSLADSRKLTPEGCTFRSHIDGSAHSFTPENNVDTQRIIGADIIMALDECTPGDADRNYARKSLDLTKQWLKRGIARFRETEQLYGYSQAFFPIVQGCVYPDLRVEAAENVASYDCEGYAIGGLSVGEPTDVMYEMIEVVHPVLPQDRPRYLMGVGGMLFTWEGRMNMRNKKWERDFSPIDPHGTSFVDTAYTKAYLRHLFVAGEMLAAQIASEHNLAFYLDVVSQARKHIEAGDFLSWKEAAVRRLQNRL